MKPFLSLKSKKDRTGQHNISFTSAFTNRVDAEDLLNIDRFSNPSHEFLAECFDALLLSDTASAMIDELIDYNWSLELDDLGGLDFHLDAEDNHLVINTHGMGIKTLQASEYFRNVTLVTLIRALRDIWQETRHGGFENDYGPESILMLERMRAADCDTVTIACAWELKELGDNDIWRHMIGSAEGDMALTFMTMMERFSKDKYKTHKAMHETFRKWFASDDRVNLCDHETLEYIDNLIATEGSEVFGVSYLTPARLEIISCLPDRTAYLQNTGHELIADPLYAGMNSIVNQSHFAQIIHDMQSTTISGVAFRDAGLAQKIFPSQQTKISINA